MSIEFTLADIKELTSAQYDACKSRAVDRVQAQIGDKPTRKTFKREYSPLWTSLDILAGVIFIAALAVSSLHILAYSGAEAAASYATSAGKTIAGLQVDSHSYGVIHQVGFILLAEAAMLLFFVLSRTRRGFERWLAGTLAVVAMAFVILANVSSGLNPFLALLAPAFTIGIGFRLEAITAESLKRNQEIDTRYLEALAVYDRAQEDVTTHPNYKAFLAQEIWEKLTSLKANQDYKDANNAFKRAAVYREMQRDSWAYDLDNVGPLPAPQTRQNGHSEVAHADPLPLMTTYSAGNGRPNGAAANGAHSS